MPSTTFAPTHEFHLLDGAVVRVAAERRGDAERRGGDWVAFEADGTLWYTVCGDLYPEWTCSSRGVYRVRRVVKYGHRYRTAGRGRSHRFECECGKHGSWVGSDDRAADHGDAHHQDAVRVQVGHEARKDHEG